MVTTANTKILDAMIRHQIGLMRYSGTLRNKVNAILNKTEADVRDQIERRLKTIAGQGVDFGPATTARLQVLEKMLQSRRTDPAFSEIKDTWTSELSGLTKSEVTYVADAVQAASPVVLGLGIPAASILRTLVTSKPFQGRTLSQWAKSIAQADQKRIMDAIKIGLVQGQTVPQIVNRVLGTQAVSGSDGVVQLTRYNLEAITRTAVNFYSNEAKAALYAENSDVISQELYVATLDSRTTAICRSLDGQTFDVGDGPTPPLHFNCRSVRVPVIDDTVIGDRPAVAATEDDLDGLNRADRSAKVAELTGTVPATTTYGDWLSSQTVAFQNQVLGVQKAQLFRNGGLTLDKFVDRQGNELTLAQLMKTEPAAFKKAGLD